MYLQQLYPLLSKKACDVITDATLKEINENIYSPFSYQTIKAERRKPALAIRMTSKPVIWNQTKVINNSIQPTGTQQSYTGKQIADIYINSVKQNNATIFPVTGTLPGRKGIEHLILFVKNNSYRPYARFDITDIIKADQITNEQLSTLLDVTPLSNTRYSIALEIQNVETDNLPQNYLGNASAEGIYDKAFNGAAPIIVCI